MVKPEAEDDEPGWELDPETEGNDLELELDPVEQAEREAIQTGANNLPLWPAPPPDDVRLGAALWCNADNDQSVTVPSSVLFRSHFCDH